MIPPILDHVIPEAILKRTAHLNIDRAEVQTAHDDFRCLTVLDAFVHQHNLVLAPAEITNFLVRQYKVEAADIETVGHLIRQAIELCVGRHYLLKFPSTPNYYFTQEGYAFHTEMSIDHLISEFINTLVQSPH